MVSLNQCCMLGCASFSNTRLVAETNKQKIWLGPSPDIREAHPPRRPPFQISQSRQHLPTWRKTRKTGGAFGLFGLTDQREAERITEPPLPPLTPGRLSA